MDFQWRLLLIFRRFWDNERHLLPITVHYRLIIVILALTVSAFEKHTRILFSSTLSCQKWFAMTCARHFWDGKCVSPCPPKMDPAHSKVRREQWKNNNYLQSFCTNSVGSSKNQFFWGVGNLITLNAVATNENQPTKELTHFGAREDETRHVDNTTLHLHTYIVHSPLLQEIITSFGFSTDPNLDNSVNNYQS